jgi:hypothetical protein
VYGRNIGGKLREEFLLDVSPQRGGQRSIDVGNKKERDGIRRALEFAQLT